jgi:hypothetical protein
MPQTRPNGTIVPINSDEYNITADLSDMADSIRVITSVADLAERDALTPFVGMQVCRLDRDGWIQTYTGTTTASGWEYKGAPRRVTAAVSSFSNAAGTADRLLYTMPGTTKSYPQSYNAKLKLSINCGAIGAGSALQVNAAVSGGNSTIGPSQGRASIAWVAPGQYLQTVSCETGWLNVAASTDPLVRAWVEVVSGIVLNTVSTGASYTHFFVEMRPQDD